MTSAKKDRQNTSAADLLSKLDKESAEELYSHAYHLYKSGKFLEASCVFRILLESDPINPKYGMGIAASYHQLKSYQNAADVYQMVGIIDHHNPIPFFHAADCLIQAEDPMSALAYLEIALGRCGGKKEYEAMKEQALLAIEKIKEELVTE